MSFLSESFFQRDFLTVARELIGIELLWRGCSGIIVETEGYAIEGDPACHTANRESTRQFVRMMPAGACYVYLNYGMYWLLNFNVKGGARDGLILIRAIEPRKGVREMTRRRAGRPVEELCSGPGKLGIALGVGGNDHGLIAAGKGRAAGCGLRKPSAEEADERFAEVVADVRVGIRLAADRPWRFLAKHSSSVSVQCGKVKPYK